ncbi:hypothetical protein [Methylobacterium sp. Leaf113]|uniref:hypothetical protein n=1 Tax=Methylobacterium sp. Leaf113 TaxID=1736259 RepID=UPI000B1D0708|nr:hypothetical protein [Methylobacterium sp. Leaf113]
MLALQMRAPFGVQNPIFPALKSGPFSKPILRRRQRPFQPPANDGPYRLPKAVQDCLKRELAAFRNAEAAFALAVFLARYWTVPNRLEFPFPVDRRALANHQALDLTEAQIRGALKTLERLGFLNRPIPKSGSRYRPTPEGLKRKAVIFEFGTDFKALFEAANQKAKRTPDRRPPGDHPQKFRSVLPLSRLATNSPKSNPAFERKVLMGDLTGSLSEEENALEKSLARLANAIGLRPEPSHLATPLV